MTRGSTASNHDGLTGRKIAVVSGKGGSGKTMVVACMSRIIAEQGYRTVVIDADVATGGLTYYIGLREVQNIAKGLSRLIAPSRPSSVSMDYEELAQSVKSIPGLEFIGVGDHRRLFRRHREGFASLLQAAIEIVPNEHCVVIDCRGGIDEESLAVCRLVDDIVLIVEPDTTSYQATEHLVDILAEEALAYKLRGFYINKVFDDPSAIARSGTGVLKTQFLSAIPFDLAATRTFLVGELLASDSVFSVHVQEGLQRAYGEAIDGPKGSVYSFQDFGRLSVRDADSVRGGMLTAGAILLLMLMLGFRLIALEDSREALNYLRSDEIVLVLYIGIVGFLGNIESFRRLLGRGMTKYLEWLGNVVL